jgi:hypothetical protein
MQTLEHTYPGTIGYLVYPFLLNTHSTSAKHTPQWVIRKVTSSGPAILLQQTETEVMSHDQSLLTDMENLRHSSLASPNKKKHEERRETERPNPNLRLNSMGTSSPLSLCAPYPMQSIRYSADNFPHVQSLLTRWASSFYNIKKLCQNGLGLKVGIFQGRDGKEGKTQNWSWMYRVLCFSCCIIPLRPISDMFLHYWTSSFFFMFSPTETHFKQPVGLTNNTQQREEVQLLEIICATDATDSRSR